MLLLACVVAVQVKLASARGLHLDAYTDRLQARLLLPDRRPVLSGAVQLSRPPQQEVGWEHEEQFTEVRQSAVCLLAWASGCGRCSRARYVQAGACFHAGGSQLCRVSA